MVTEIDIWRVANLILKRYGDKALEETVARELMSARPSADDNGAATWRRIAHAVLQLANKAPPSSVLRDNPVYGVAEPAVLYCASD